MRKLLFALSACVLCAAPLQAQSAASLAPEPQAPAAEAVTPEPQRTPKPSLYPTMDEVRQQVASAERERAQKAAIPNDFLYLVAAIVVGVVIAVLLLD